MGRKADLWTAISLIQKHGILLVYPIDNRPEPLSLWSVLYPRSRMRWEWDTGGDDRVSRLWHLREELSRSGKVVYAKWYRGRATFFSREVFTALLSVLGSSRGHPRGLSREAHEILEILSLDSPLSTKQLKRAADLTGKANERTYERAMKELWERLLIVGFGEVDEGAFPSLAVGATQLLFEDLWEESRELEPAEALAAVDAALRSKGGGLFFKQLEKQHHGITRADRPASPQ